MIIHVQKDKQKAQSLKSIANITLERLESIDILKYPSNSLEDYYNIIHRLMEAITSLKGIKIKGEGAHQELIDYISKEYSFDESIRLFLQQIRDYRNRISYEGLNIKENYILQNKKKIETIIKRLSEIYTKEMD